MGGSHEAKTEVDKNILAELSQTTEAVTRNLGSFRLNEAAQTIYDFVWHKFADVYIEASKTNWQTSTLTPKRFTAQLDYDAQTSASVYVICDRAYLAIAAREKFGSGNLLMANGTGN